MFRSEASEDDIQSTKELQNTESLGTKIVDILTKTLGGKLHQKMDFFIPFININYYV